MKPISENHDDPSSKQGRAPRGGGLLRRLVPLAGLGLLALASHAQAAGLMTPVGGAAPLVLDEQHVDVTVENGYARTRVEQVFANPHGHDLEARYRFPVPDSAAVGEFTYWIDGVPVQGEVLEKAEARRLHESQRRQGAESALIEKESHRTFEVMVTPVRAGQDVRVRLVYLQRAPLDHSVGRYVYPLEEGGVDTARDSFWTRDERVASAFSFRLRLRSAYPVDAVRVPNGQATITRVDSGEWEVTIASSSGAGASRGEGLGNDDLHRMASEGEGTPPLASPPLDGAGDTDSHRYRFVLDDAGAAPLPHTPLPPRETSRHGADHAVPGADGDARRGAPAHSLERDIVVYWRLAEDLPGAVDLLTYRAPGAPSGTFMLTLTPGIDLAPIDEGRDWVFVLDTSGSMAGKFTALTEGVRQALGSLEAADRYRVILFSDRATELTRGFVTADRASVEATLRRLDKLQAGGGTNLFDGLRQASRSLESDRTTAMVLVTDGVANVGPTEMTRFLELLEPLDIRLFTAVMGNSADRPLLEGLAAHSGGFALNVSNEDDIVGLLMQVTSKVTHEALHDIDVRIDGVRTSALTLAAHARVFRGEQLVLLGRYGGAGQGRVTLSADVSGRRESYVSTLDFPAESTENPELERLWAFATIKALEATQRLVGETDDSRRAITDIALEYALVTDRTSMVVVREEVFAAHGIERRNASRVERERLARAVRDAQPVSQTRQDVSAPAFPSQRHTPSNGGGSFGVWLLVALAVLATLRVGLGLGERVRERRDGLEAVSDREGGFGGGHG